jgi:hypothetical protein
MFSAAKILLAETCVSDIIMLSVDNMLSVLSADQKSWCYLIICYYIFFLKTTHTLRVVIFLEYRSVSVGTLDGDSISFMNSWCKNIKMALP